jgi:two-component system, chemotaxis family, chemotaxis protein CheY
MNDQRGSDPSPDTSRPVALVVDDSRTMRNILSDVLAEVGFEILEACNGKEALIQFQREEGRILLVVSDWNMPEMNGLELLQALRQAPWNSTVPYVMVTTESDSDQMATALAAGTTEYVKKPFTREVIKAKLSRYQALATS